MALSDFLNKDPFAAGGVMDAPDLQVRTAMNKLSWGIPLTQQEARRVTARQGLEQQSINTAQENARKQALLGMQGVDVSSYAGSMWAKPGSYSAARPIASRTGYNPEATADALLKQRFGTMQPGQVQVAYGGSRPKVPTVTLGNEVLVLGGNASPQDVNLSIGQQPAAASTAQTFKDPNVMLGNEVFTPQNIANPQIGNLFSGQPAVGVLPNQNVDVSGAGVSGPYPAALEAIMAGPGGSGSNSGQISFMGQASPVSPTQNVSIPGVSVSPLQSINPSGSGVKGPSLTTIEAIMAGPGGSGANAGRIAMGSMAPVSPTQNVNVPSSGVSSPSSAVIDSMLGGAQPMTAPQTLAPSAFQQLAAINKQYGQLPQTMALEATTPRQQELAQSQSHFDITQRRMAAEQQQKQRMGQASSMLALGQDISGLNLSPEEL
ncbi:MAG: hypothetical protein EBR82_10370, partial [Caulobacteraceae bacterium]|nr:hypothetical protein [Caulobacteraceae bacterium]